MNPHSTSSSTSSVTSSAFNPEAKATTPSSASTVTTLSSSRPSQELLPQLKKLHQEALAAVQNESEFFDNQPPDSIKKVKVFCEELTKISKGGTYQGIIELVPVILKLMAEGETITPEMRRKFVELVTDALKPSQQLFDRPRSSRDLFRSVGLYHVEQTTNLEEREIITSLQDLAPEKIKNIRWKIDYYVAGDSIVAETKDIITSKPNFEAYMERLKEKELKCSYTEKDFRYTTRTGPKTATGYIIRVNAPVATFQNLSPKKNNLRVFVK